MKPVFVFDGLMVPDVKRATLRKRREAEREGAEKRDYLTGQLLEARMKQDILRQLEAEPESQYVAPTLNAELVDIQQAFDQDFSSDLEDEREEIRQKSLREKIVLAMEKHQPDILTLEELQSINIDSAGFAQLPVEVQIGLLQEIRQRTKLKHWDVTDMNVEETQEFSRNQIRSVVQKSVWSRKLDHLQNRGGYSKTAEGSTVIRRRVAAEKNTEYILVKNDSKASWTLKQVEQAIEQPLSYNNNVRVVEEAALKDYMHFEDELSMDDRKTLLMNNLTEEDRKVTLYGEWMMKVPEDIDDQILHDVIYKFSDQQLQSEYQELVQKSAFMGEFLLAVLKFRNLPVRIVQKSNPLFQVVSDDEDKELPQVYEAPVRQRSKNVESRKPKFIEESDSDSFEIASSNITPVKSTSAISNVQSSIKSEVIPVITEQVKVHQQLQSQEIVSATAMNPQMYDAEIDRLRRERNQAVQGSAQTSAELILDIQELLRDFGIPYVVAPSEAEAQCAQLLKLRLVDGIISDDSDVLVCGGSLVYRNMFTKSKYIEQFTMEAISQKLHLDQERLIMLAYLLGCDYTDGVTGVGPVLAMEILADIVPTGTEFDVIDTLKQFQLQCLEGSGQLGKRMKRLVFPSNFPDPRVYEAYKDPVVDDSAQIFEWSQPNIDRLRAFLLAKLHWGQQKVDGMLLPVLKSMKSPRLNQTNLDAWIVSSPSSSSSTIPSRMSKALSKMANQDTIEEPTPKKRPAKERNPKQKKTKLQRKLEEAALKDL